MILETKLLTQNLGRAASALAYPALQKALAAPDQILDAIKASGLRGRSGSGFPTGAKWETVRQTPSDVKYIICNADEGEPCTGKDHVLLTGDPHAILEGMVIAGICTGAEKGYLYLRGEYQDAAAVLRKAIKAAKAAHLLGSRILDTDYSFDVELRYGAGAYICGEETALLESIEGRRGEARLKPPYPGVSGLWGKPTLINNVETFANIPLILRIGPEAYRTYGTPEYPGTKLVTVSGCVNAPGVYEISAGATMGDILELAGGCQAGKALLAVQTGGGSGPIVDLSHLDMPFDVEHCNRSGAFFGTGSLMFIDDSVCLLSLCENMLEFFVHESCGRCVPCRIGLHKAKDMLHEMQNGPVDAARLDALRQLLTDIKRSARCAFGPAAVTPVISAMDNFPGSFYTTKGGEGQP